MSEEVMGDVYVEVEYDYSYECKERTISIRQGERYLLVRRTNDDWWQVRAQAGTRAFYVPAQYVRPVKRALLPPPCKPSVLPLTHSHQNTHTSATHTHTHTHGQENAASAGRGKWHVPVAENSTRPSPTNTPSPSPGQLTPPAVSAGPDANRNQAECGGGTSRSSSNNNNHVNHRGNTTLPRGRAESPPLRQTADAHGGLPSETEADGESPGERSLSVSGSGSMRNDSESGDDLSSSSTEHMQSEENSLSTYSSQSDSQYGSPPRGWSEELDEHGHTLYVCEYTHEKWMKHVDDQGRPYYYSADGSRSEWELPKYSLSPPAPCEVQKSHSLDRKQSEPIVLTKWRHSTYLLELTDKLSVQKRRFSTNTLGLSLCSQQESGNAPKQNSPDSDSCPSSPKHASSPSEKCGVLNVTKITENGKKVRKNWASTWTVLQGSSLLFAKGQTGTSWSLYSTSSFPELILSLISNWTRSIKPRPAVSYVQSGRVKAASKFGGGQSKPEFSVDLRGGSVDWASKDKSSKKHVIELKTRQGTELLIQSEIDSVINDWFRALCETVNTHAWESDEAIEEDMPESPTEKHDKEKDHRDSKKNRGSKGSVNVDAEQKKTRVKLKKFLTRRPTLQAVRDKGYIKDQVFGCSLSSLCQRENSTVPSFVRMCIDHVEKTGLSIDGLYRVSGNLAVIQKLRFAINHDEMVELDDSKWEDIHVTTGALKMFFRELPEPLFTYASFNDFVNAIKCPDYQQRVGSVRDLIRQLPRPNQDTMQTLFKHLRRVIDHGDENRMTSQSVAIVFGPTLLRPEAESGNMAVHMVYQNQIVELVLLEQESIFGR
ncbi:rho GTPase-activating protein 12-like [Alosa pseudoharengus]|uniref:rho GTPase-activating protein 12-like n=1 Tax=Alosa pseudoharengus TaxID=34774 RepID=UPI003F8C9A78